MTGPTSDAEIPGFWQGLGLLGLADIHVQFLPPRMLRRTWDPPDNSEQPVPKANPRIAPVPGSGTAREAGPRTDRRAGFWPAPPFGPIPGPIPTLNPDTRPRPSQATWASQKEGQSKGPGKPRTIIYKWSDDERVEHLRTIGVRMFTALGYADRPGMAADLNAWTQDFASRTPGCVPGATVYPEPGVNRYTRIALDAGARIFKVRFTDCGITAAHALLDAVWGVLAEAGIPVIVDDASCGTVHTGPGPLAAVLRRHPRLVAIVARLGAPDYVDFLELSERYERVCLDTSLGFTPFLEEPTAFPQAQLARLRELGLRGKILLGSEFPNLPHPYAKQLAALAELDLGDDWLRAVCWQNAADLLELS